MQSEPYSKKAKLEVLDIPLPRQAGRSAEEVEKGFRDAVKSHPFFDNVHSVADVYQDGVLRDGKGNVLGVLVKQGLPEYAAKMAAEVLRSAAVRTTLRANMFGGQSPLSGIAGYFDYRGSPIEHKFRKTAFTFENHERWPDVFPMIDYVSEIYKRVMPENWARQDAAIPDVVRIHGSPFSTLTINSRFRTAHHTDAGDFDDGYGCLACLEGQFKGLALTFDDFRVNFVMQPRDVLIFNTHHFHSNTEVELLQSEDWTRLSCVFYYRWSLGEPAAYEEYHRRLAQGLRDRATLLAPPQYHRIEQKDNGTNSNRPATVHPIQLTPFALAGVVHALNHAAFAGEGGHQCLRANGEAAERALFGEPLHQPLMGLPVRCEAEMDLPHVVPEAFKAPATGGFREHDLTVKAAAERQRCLNPEVLAGHISTELLDMWRSARTHWLDLVKVEWGKMCDRDPKRSNFTWNNRSEMNAAFFDLCEVARQVLLGMLERDTATAQEEQSFWALYASHLNVCCVETLRMPAEAMSLKKLNVKIKDFMFGGTRYFKDMPPDEQARRLARQQRIEAARRNKAKNGAEDEPKADWLANDTFDYQSEDRPVEYVANGHVTPADNADAVIRAIDASPATTITDAHGYATGTIRVLVILPSCAGAGTVKQSFSSGLTEEQRQGSECQRILGNPAARKILEAASPPQTATLPSDCSFGERRRGAEGEERQGRRMEVTYSRVTDNDPIARGPFDFVILQHALSTQRDDAAACALVERAAAVTTGAVFVEETDLHDRQFFRLQNEVRTAYWSVARGCFQELHYAAYGTQGAHLRTKAELEAILPTCCARYKFTGSPLNTTVMVIPGRAR